MKKNFIILLFVLIISSFIVSASWDQYGYNVLNSFVDPVSINNLGTTHIQDIAKTNADIVPIAVDSDGDNYDELIVFENNLLKSYKYNVTTGLYSLWSNADITDAVSQMFYDSTREFIYITTKTAFYAIKYDSSGFSNVYSASLSHFVRNGAGMNCLPYIDNATCILRTNSTYYDIISVENDGTITETELSSPYLSDLDNQIGYKPSLFPINEYPYYAGILTCNQSGKFGVMEIYMNNGSIAKQNCSVTSNTVFGNPRVYKVDGVNWAILLQSYTATSKGRCEYINKQLTETTGFPIGTDFNGAGGCLFNAGTLQFIQPTTGYSVYNLTPAIIRANASMASGVGVYKDSLIAINDYVFGFGYIGKQTSSYALDLVGDATYKDSIILRKGSDYTLVYSGSALLKLYSAQTQLTYPDWTLQILNNKTGNAVESVNYAIYNLTNSLFLQSFTNSEGKEYIGNFLPTGIYYLTATKSGYYKLNASLNITNGLYTKIYYIEPNLTDGSSLRVTFYDSSDLTTIKNVTFSLNYYNPSTQIWTGCAEREDFCNVTTLGYVEFPNISSGNYSVIAKAEGGYRDLSAKHFYVAGATTQELYFTKLLSLSSYKPVVVDINTSIYKVSWTWFDSKDLQGSPVYNVSEDGRSYVPVYTLVENPPTFCVNQTIYINVKVAKADNEAVSGRLNYDYFGTTYADVVLPIRTPENGFAYLPWAIRPLQSGTFGIFVYAWSNSFPYYQNPIQAYNEGLTLIKNITVLDCEGANFTANGDYIEPTSTAESGTSPDNAPVTNLIQGFFGLLGARTSQAIAQASYLVIFLFAMIIGLVALFVTRDWAGLLFGSAGTGLFFSLFFFVFKCIPFGSLFLFCVVFLLMGSIALIKGLGGGQPSSPN